MTSTFITEAGPPTSPQPAQLPELSGQFADVQPADRMAMHEDVGLGVRKLFIAVRETVEYPDGYEDGLAVAYGRLRPGYTHERVGRIATAALDRGIDPRKVHGRYFDMSGTSAPVRDRLPGETLEEYMDYMAGTALQRSMPADTGMDLCSPNPMDIPGTRFRSDFGAFDTSIVAMGKVRRGDLEGARRSIDNIMHNVMRFGGIPNISTAFSLDRWQTPHVSLAIEAFANAYGDRAQEVLAHYAVPLKIICDSWMEGRERLHNVPPGEAAAYKRQAVLPGRAPNGEPDYVYRNFSDEKPNMDTLRGLRLESLLEDNEIIERALHGLTGEERKRRFEQLCIDIRAACESTKDFQPSTQSADGFSLHEMRTTRVAPVMLQSLIAHLCRVTAAAWRARGEPQIGRPYQDESNRIGDVLNRRFWRETGPDEGHYGDILADGQPVDAFDLTMSYPLLVGGLVPHDRAVRSANLFKRRLGRQYGFLISDATTGQQWDGDPDDDDRQSGKKGENRGWMSTIMLAAESFQMAALDAKAGGHDPEPLIRAAEVGLGGVRAVEIGLDTYGHIREKVNVVRPEEFVNGGEYGKRPETVQKGFGMQIGATRQLIGRDFRAEVKDPAQSWRRLTVGRAAGNLLALAA